MKKILICILFSTGISSKAMQYFNPQTYVSSTDYISIVNVCFEKSSTTISLCLKKGSVGKVRFSSNMYLSNMKGERFPVRDSEMLDTPITINSDTVIDLRFPPIAKGRDVIDLIDPNSIGLYGIHDVSYEMIIPDAGQGHIDRENINGIYQNALTTIKGRLINPAANDSNTKMLYLRYSDLSPNLDNAKDGRCCIQQDGSFSMTLNLDHPVWAVICDDKMQKIGWNIFIRPGDHISFCADEKNKWKESVIENASGKETFHTLMNNYPGDIMESTTSLLRKIGPEMYLQHIDSLFQQRMRMFKYISWKYSFNETEKSLYYNKIIFDRDYYRLWVYTTIESEKQYYNYFHEYSYPEFAALMTSRQDFSVIRDLNPVNPVYFMYNSFYSFCQLMRNVQFMKDLNNKYFISDNGFLDCIVEQNDMLNKYTEWNGMSYFMQYIAIMEAQEGFLKTQEVDSFLESFSKLPNIHPLIHYYTQIIYNSRH